MAIPKPDPKIPPPVIGENGVKLTPSAGCPFGFKTIKHCDEYEYPCTTLLLIHIYPFLSNATFAGPPNGHELLPVLLNLIAIVNASNFCK